MKLRTIILIIAAVLLGYTIISNFRSFNKLSQATAKNKMTTRNFAYKSIFADTSRFSNTFTFYGDKNRDSIGGYVVDNMYDLVLYKIGNLKSNDTSIFKKISFVKSRKIKPTSDVIYESSYKTEAYRFSLALNKLNSIEHLEIHYDGEMVGKPLFTPSSIEMRLINLVGLAALADDEKQTEFLIKKRNLFTRDFSLQMAIFKIDNAVYFAALSNRENPRKQIERDILGGLVKK